MPSLTEVEADVQSLDPALDRDDEAFKVAVVLLAALQVGADVERVAEFTQFDREWLEGVAANLTASGIWQDGHTACSWFEEGGGIEFWIDVLVGQGLVEKS